MTTTCSHCRHWLRQINDFGQCRRFPPQLYNGAGGGRHPTTHASDLCGEFDAASDDELRHLYSWAVAQTDLMPELGPPMGSAFTGEGYVTISGEGATIQEAIAD